MDAGTEDLYDQFQDEKTLRGRTSDEDEQIFVLYQRASHMESH